VKLHDESSIDATVPIFSSLSLAHHLNRVEDKAPAKRQMEDIV
jgi:hypothetical protein